MRSITSLVKKLKVDYPKFIFQKDSSFSWSHENNTIYYTLDNNACFLLHELSHALLDHIDYDRDIELITMERDAWNKARSLAKSYRIIITDEFIQSNLDNYRNWLHIRSLCPKCNASGLQTNRDIYICVVCNHKWKVNEARKCALRRYSIKKSTKK